MGLALGLISAGLLSSAGHLGRPERAWRAFSQWRSSWLSREGVASVATFVPAGLFAIGWVFLGRTDGWVAVAGLLAGGRRGRHRLHHRHDLRLAEADRPVAQPLHFARLPDLFGDERQRASQRAAAGFALGSTIVLTGCVLLTLLGWGWKLATWRYNDRLGNPDQRQHRDRTCRRYGAVAGMAAHRRKLPAQGDGLSHRAQAQGAAAPDHATAGLRSARLAADCRVRPCHGPMRRCCRHSPHHPNSPACWSNAGCSSPKRNTPSPSTMAGRAAQPGRSIAWEMAKMRSVPSI